MKFLFPVVFFILLIGSTSAGQISLNYSSESNSENITFTLEIFNFSTSPYDVKIDLISEDKRISRIWDVGWKSSRYYVNKAIYSGEEKEFLINVGDFQGRANITVKIRDESKKIEVFDNYSILITKEKEEIQEKIPEEVGESREDSKEKDKENGERIAHSPNHKAKEKETPRVNSKTIYEPINLNPKTIKSEKNSIDLEKAASNYSIVGFSLLLLLLYLLNPKKQKKNEFRN